MKRINTNIIINKLSLFVLVAGIVVLLMGTTLVVAAPLSSVTSVGKIVTVVANPPTFWELVRAIFGRNLFTIVGVDWSNLGYSTTPDITIDNIAPGTTFSHNANEYCSSGYGLFDVFVNNYVPRFEMLNGAEFLCGTGNQKCIVEVYCGTHPQCSSHSDCNNWVGTGSQCLTKNAVDPYMPLMTKSGTPLSSYKYCSSSCSGTSKTCWRIGSSNTCEDSTYDCSYSTYSTIVDTNCASGAGSFIYGSLSACQSNICSGQTRACIASNTCQGTQTCSNNVWGTCTTSLTKCTDGTCKTSCGTVCDYGSCSDVSVSCNSGVDCPTKCGTIGNSAGKIVECLPPSLGSCWANTGLPCGTLTNCSSPYFGTCTSENQMKCGTDSKQLLRCTKNIGVLCWSDAGHCGNNCSSGECVGDKEIGESCATDLECKTKHCDRTHWYSLSQTCQPTPWDELKKVAMSKEDIKLMTTQDKMALLCTSNSECISKQPGNYTAKCIPIAQLREEGVVTEGTKEFWDYANGFFYGTLGGGLLGGTLAGGACVGAGAIIGFVFPASIPAIIAFGPEICTGVTLVGGAVGAYEGLKVGLSIDSKSELAKAIDVEDDNSAGLCVLSGKVGWCGIAEKLAFIGFMDDKCVEGSIIIGILSLLGIVLFMRM